MLAIPIPVDRYLPPLVNVFRDRDVEHLSDSRLFCLIEINTRVGLDGCPVRTS